MQALAGADGRRIKHNDEPGRLSLPACHRDGQMKYRGNADWGDRNEPIYLIPIIPGYFVQQFMSILGSVKYYNFQEYNTSVTFADTLRRRRTPSCHRCERYNRYHRRPSNHHVCHAR